MIVKYPDGRVEKRPVTDCTGYHADGLLLDQHDLRKLDRMDNQTLLATVRQLAVRVKLPKRRRG